MVGISSPPYEDCEGQPSLGSVNKDRWGEEGTNIVKRRGLSGEYGQSSGQIGNEKSESYLSAMRQVYSEAAKVCDVLALVTKNPTRNGRLRKLDEDTIALLEATGWRIVCHHHAILFEEQESQDLFGDTHKKAHGRLGFFKRLSWQKGAEVAKWEDVIIAVHDGHGMAKGICSPPYQDSLQTKDKDFLKKIADDAELGLNRGHAHGKKGLLTELEVANRYGQTPGQIGNLK